MKNKDFKEELDNAEKILYHILNKIGEIIRTKHGGSIMSKTTETKSYIMKYLSDNKIHEVSDIKKYLRDNYDKELSEGVIAGAIKTMTVSGVIECTERGRYRQVKKKEETKTNSLIDQIIELTEQYEKDAIGIINNIDITEQNLDDIKQRIELRKKIERACSEIKKL